MVKSGFYLESGRGNCFNVFGVKPTGHTIQSYYDPILEESTIVFNMNIQTFRIEDLNCLMLNKI